MFGEKAKKRNPVCSSGLRQATGVATGHRDERSPNTHRWSSLRLRNDEMFSPRLRVVRGSAVWWRVVFRCFTLLAVLPASQSLEFGEQGGPELKTGYLYEPADPAALAPAPIATPTATVAPPRRLLASRRQLTTASCGGVSFTVASGANFVRSCTNSGWDVYGDCHFNAGKGQSGNQ